jgi:hypothetical protein
MFKTRVDRHAMIEILLKVVLNTINQANENKTESGCK